MRQNERQSEERRGWASHWGFTNCHSEEGERVCSKERSCWSVLWIGSLFLPFFFPPRHRLDKSRTSCSCYGRKRRKCAVSLGRSVPAGQIGRTRTRNGPRGVCRRVCAQVRAVGALCALCVSCSETQTPPTHTHTHKHSFPSPLPPSSLYCVGKYEKREESRPEVWRILLRLDYSSRSDLPNHIK